MADPTIVRAVGDSGEVVELVDVVDGAWGQHLAPLQEMLAEFFPDEPYAIDLARRDAVRPAERTGMVVHQFVVLVDGVPAGISVYHSNLVRGVSAPHFGAVRPEYRRVIVDGHRLGGWLSYEQLRRLGIDAGALRLGAVGEATADNALAWARLGWRILPVDTYAMPVHGWEWPTQGLEMRPMKLVWLPPIGATADEIVDMEPRALAAGAAAFLLDTYGLPTDHEMVRALVGEQALRPGPSRD
ncbi:MAG: hypothetical protein RI958_598 [Actinomycetota bacterium]|jgi:hypothetical protein